MKIMLCDSCGKEIEKATTIYSETFLEFQLCDECVNTLFRFLKTDKKNKERAKSISKVEQKPSAKKVSVKKK